MVQVQSATEAPRVRPAPISAKRDFERLITEICRAFSNSRSIALQYMEELQASTMSKANNQSTHLFQGSLGQVIGSGVGILAVIFGKQDPRYFDMGSKAGDIFKNIMDSCQVVDQSEKEKVQYASNQWQTFANGVQEAIRNLKMGQQRLQQAEDSHR